MKSAHCYNTPKILLFDFGCILTGLSKQRCIDALNHIGCGRIAYYVDECKQEDLFHDLEVGGSIEAFCEEARRQSSYTDEMGVFHPCKATNEEICWAWNELLTGIPVEKLRMVRYLHDVLGYRTAILSNTNEIHWQKSIKDYFTIDGSQVEDYFDEIFLSCDLGMIKPYRCIFEEVKQRMAEAVGRKGEADELDFLFIDDSEKNCQAAEAAGIRTLHDPLGNRWMQHFGTAAIIGNFDGVHLGHRHVIDSLKSIAAERNLMPVAITFDRHPRVLFDPTFEPKLLTTLQEKQELLAKEVMSVRTLHFTREVAQLSAYDFMKDVLRDEMGVKVLLLGYDNRFGRRNETEDFECYRRYGEELGIEVLLAEPINVGEKRVSSSLVRHLVKEGCMEEVAECLGRGYGLTGTVEKGFQEGRKIGFPTANISVAENKLLPPNGVYASRTMIEGEEGTYESITNIGHRPTYNGSRLSVETFLRDFNGDLYGKKIKVELLRKVREERRFLSAEELREQIKKDLLA